MKSNGLLKWLMIPVVLFMVWVGIKLFSGTDDSPIPSAKEPKSNALTKDEMKALGVEGDTPRDTVATLVAQVKQLRQEMQAAVADNKQQKQQNEQLRQRENTIDQRIKTAIDAERGRWRGDQEKAANDEQQTQGLLRDMQRRLEGIGKRNSPGDLPVGFGLEDGDQQGFDTRERWIEPQDARPASRKSPSNRSAPTPDTEQPGASIQPAAEQSQESSETVADTLTDVGRAITASASVEPRYTVPSDSTLVGSIAMTALVGRIPIDGTVNDPFPFKVLIGPDNLTANGIDLPDVVGAVASGSASGDWTLSCVRGRIRSFTFVFKDGTVRSVATSSSRNDDGNGGALGGLGWISDPYGIPCVSGKRVSNAQQYLGSQMLITAAGAGAASLIKSDSNFSFVQGSNGSLGTVGISGNEAMSRILGSGVQDMSQWVNKLYGQAFAAIYVQPLARVAVHIEQALEIDYDTKGRKVKYATGELHVPNLD